MDLSQRVKEIANNHDNFVGLTRDKYNCEKCQAKAPATIFESASEGMKVAVFCCSSCGDIIDVEKTMLG